ncbi:MULTISPECIES: ABC transporter ATP-binding protein [unclassified Variovorax]|uniref:ABC transporter ATP-binding protein n=1 Tax=unclassified Variovorax TaxID=663243 RepID=UPI002574DCDD|nr:MULTISPECIES: ABC transporter ATP-binding protein [unclassified Variovorax]MDM0089328.1 ABC transporter ATP-binding protein [Variovorax sp. J22G40]MDM0147401.1 ABC transporter ATP-binding protein [Variovorax sp. J2P1-31]
MLETRDLRAGYGRVPVLHGITLEAGAREITGILGRNGMGKTTLLKALMGELPATGGTLALAGQDLTRARPHERARAGIGYVPQGRQIFPFLTVAQNLRMGCAKNFATAEATIARVLQHFPRLQRLLEQPGGSLSGGEQQLLALARCLCGDPKLILLDEPTEGIQPSICDEIVETLLQLRERDGLAVVLVEQDIEFLCALCDRILVIDKGVFTGAIDPRQTSSEEIARQFTDFHA